jgi:hypothetical protein
VCLLTLHFRVAAQQTPDWGSGVAPFAFALIGDMPYGTGRETPFARLVALRQHLSALGKGEDAYPLPPFSTRTW